MNIIFFDDNCLICNSFVRLLIKLDKKDQLYFASLKSGTAEERLGDRFSQIDSVIYSKNNREYLYSDAVIEILLDLNVKVKFLKLIPKKIRDGLYHFVARNRHRLKKQKCELPDARMREKILR